MQLKASRKLTDHHLLTEHFIPAHFVSGRNKHFQHSWLEQHNGLVYSESEDGGYCKYCVVLLGMGLRWSLVFLSTNQQLTSKGQLKNFHITFTVKCFTRHPSLEAAAAFKSVD